MKTKRILITYVNNGNLQGQIAKEYMFNKIVNDLMDEGRKVAHEQSQPFSKTVSFEDGTKVYVTPFSNTSLIRGGRFTHIYIDGLTFSLTNGYDFANHILTSLIRTNIVSDQFEISEPHRAFSYHYLDGQVNIKTIGE